MTELSEARAREIEDLAYLITSHRFSMQGIPGAIGEPDLELARPLAAFLIGEGYQPPSAPVEGDEREALAADRDRWKKRCADETIAWSDATSRADRAEANWRAAEDELRATQKRLDALLARPSTPTEEDVERAAKAMWVAQQDDRAWAESVVDDVFSPADDWPEECVDLATLARAALSAVHPEVTK